MSESEGGRERTEREREKEATRERQQEGKRERQGRVMKSERQ